MVTSPLENKTIEEFINSLNLNKDQKEKLIGKVPSLSDEEKVFLWKTLIDIYNLDEEEKKAIEKIEKQF